MIGTSIAHYEIVKKLGSGGMGDVYLALDSRLDRSVALKVLPAEFTSDSARLGRFVKEARAASALDHPNVADIYEIGEYNGINYIAMQYVEGQTLREQIEHGPVTTKDIIDITIQLADALDEAHSKGIIHRDIKPANIMITPRGQVKVLDFGLAKINPQPGSVAVESTMTDTGAVVGTVQYMSPEQALGKVVDGRSDLFSIGIVMYQMATGRIPFRGDNPVDTLQKILDEQPDAIGRFNYSIPQELERIILKCLEKEPSRRYQSARDLLVDLKNLKRDTESGKITASLQHRPAQKRWLGVTTLLLLALAAVAVYVSVGRGPSGPIGSIAVLPFTNESGATSNEYLSDGITDNTINRLSQIAEIKVLARATVFTYKGKQLDPRKVGRELDVDAVVIGSLLQQQDALRVSVSLVRTSDGAHLWGEQYNRSMSDIFAVQSDISKEISEQLRVKLTGQEQKQLNKEYTNNVEAYRLYLQGVYYVNKRTRDDFQRAISSFQQAIALDPDYALAYAGLADAYGLLSNWGFLPAREGYSKAKESARKALELDSSLAEAYTSLASIRGLYDWEWRSAEEDFRKAIALNPNYATAHHWYSFQLAVTGRYEEAIREIRLAQQLDPLSMVINANVGFVLYLARRYDEAISELKKTIDLDPNFALAYEYLMYAYEQKKDYPKAVAAAQKAVDIAPDVLTFEADLARAYAVAGRKEEARRKLDDLLRISAQTYVTPFDIASVYVGLGEKDKAMEWLERAYNEHADQVTYIHSDPRFDPLRNDPRFQLLLKRLGLV